MVARFVLPFARLAVSGSGLVSGGGNLFINTPALGAGVNLVFAGGWFTYFKVAKWAEVNLGFLNCLGTKGIAAGRCG